MNFQYANALIVTAMIFFSLSGVAFQRRKAPGGFPLAVTLFALGIWTFSYGLRWTTSDLREIYFWLNLTYLGIVTTPAAMVVFTFQYTQHPFQFSLRHYAFLAIEPVITLIILWTDPLHNLFFGGSRNPDSILAGGIWFHFNAVYTYILLILSIVVLIRHIQNSINVARQQGMIILIGFLIPVIVSGLQIWQIVPSIGLDLTPFVFLISTFVVMIGFFYYRLLDITPIAYSRLFQNSANGLIVVDSQWRIVDVNPVGRQILGQMTAGIGSDVRAVFASQPDIIRLLNSNEMRSTIIRLDIEGNDLDYDTALFPIRTNPTQPDGWLLVFHDITAFRRTEEALMASENKIRSLFQSITDPVLVIDQKGKYLEIAPTKPNSQIHDPLRIVGRSVADVFPKEEARQIMDAIQETLRTRSIVHLDYRMVIEGKEFWYAGSVSPLTEDTVIWLARDITERKKMEQDLRERELRLGLAHEIAHVGYWEYSLNDKQFWASDEFYKIMGVNSRSGISSLGKLEKFFSLKNRNHWSESSREWLESLPNREVDIEITRKGETEPRILHTITRVEYNDKNKPVKIVGVVHDVTNQKRAERALEKRMMALTLPLEKNQNFALDDLFNLDDLQHIQDDFSNALGVASVITRLDGTPITKYSNFTRLCGSLIRQNPQGCADCISINATDSKNTIDGKPYTVPCPNTNLMHASAPIMVGGKHIANWLVGQVRLNGTKPDAAMAYIRQLGLNETDALQAFNEIQEVSEEQFEKATRALFTLSTYLSNTAYQNVQQARFITDRKKAEEALRLSEAKLRSLFTAMTDVIIVYGSDGEYREIASTNSQRYYRPPHELLHRRITDVFPEDIATLFMRTIRQTLELKEMSRVDYSLTIGGREYWFSANVSPFTEDSVIWVARDITDRKKVEDALHYQSTHDTLTGLYNRQYYETEIDRLQHSRLFPISIIMIDVDGLKWVNDHRGHQAGDELLQRVAGLLKSAFRPEDMVARMGGDEFVVVLPLTAEPAARQAISRLEEILEKHNQLFSPEQKLGLSMGTATGTSGSLLTEVFKIADQAMYTVKSRKKAQSANPDFVPQDQTTSRK